MTSITVTMCEATCLVGRGKRTIQTWVAEGHVAAFARGGRKCHRIVRSSLLAHARSVNAGALKVTHSRDSERRCTTCGDWWPLGCFGREKRGYLGYGWRCKACRYERRDVLRGRERVYRSLHPWER